jgi:hypothetical protein
MIPVELLAAPIAQLPVVVQSGSHPTRPRAGGARRLRKGVDLGLRPVGAPALH